MIRIGLTMRSANATDYRESRDAIDKRWMTLMRRCGLLPVLLPNDRTTVETLVRELGLSGFILTGGGDIGAVSGVHTMRDRVERWIIEFSISKKLPLFGVCRGMQAIQAYFGIRLHPVEGHVLESQVVNVDGKSVEVNSFHRWGTDMTVEELRMTAIAADGVIKGIKHCELPIQAVMWHPERQPSFAKHDIDRIKKHFSQITQYESNHLSSGKRFPIASNQR